MKVGTKKYYLWISCLSALAVAFLSYVWLSHTDLVSNKPVIEIIVDADRASMIQLMVKEGDQYYTNEIPQARWNEPVQNYKVSLPLPEVDFPGGFRIDLGATTTRWKIHSIALKGRMEKIVFTGDSIIKYFTPNQYFDEFKVLEDQTVEAVVSGHDAYLESNFALYPIMDKLNKTPFPDGKILFPAIVFGIFASMLLYFMLKRIHPFQYNPVHVTYVFLFGFLISAPLIKMMIAPEEEASENRKLASKPVLSTSNTFAYPALFNQYFQENFGFRKLLTTLNSYWRFKLLNSSSMPERVVIGKKSWLYSTDYDIAGDYRNSKLFTKDELEQIRKNLEELYVWYKQRNIKFYVFIAPSKYRIYPEFLPSRLKINRGISKLEQLVAYMHEHSFVKIITAHEQLLQAKPNAEVFYAHDTHWNFQGGFIGYQVLMREINADFPELGILSPDDFNRVKTRHPNADLARMLSLEKILLNDEWAFEKKYPSEAYPGKFVHYQTVSPLYPSIFVEHKNAALPRAIFYRDSFTNLMLPFLINHFSRTCFVWTYEHSLEVAEIEKPNLVVMEIIENRIDRLLEKNPKELRVVP
jgi:hypothetical protein